MSEDKPVKIDKRKSPEHLEHLRNIGFAKGRTKTGGAKALEPDVKAALKERTLDAIETLTDVMFNSSNDNARVRAAAYFLDPFLPRAPKEITVTHSHSIADMLSEINQLRLKDERESRKTIDITPNKEPDEQTIEDQGYSIV